MACNLQCLIVLCLAATAASLSSSAQMREQTLEKEWNAELEESTKDTPIQRVVKLLNEMKANLEKEAAEDEELYDKIVCWCETNEKEKTKAIADAEAKDLSLVAEIEQRAARHGVLGTEIPAAKDEIAEFKTTLAEASDMRDKDMAEFMGEEKDMVQALMNLKNAILVLGKHNGGSLMQLSKVEMSAIRTVLQDVSQKHEILLGDQKSTHTHIKAALISVGAVTSSQEYAQGSAFLHSIRGALNAYGMSDSSDMLPEKFAARVLAEHAKKVSVGVSFVQQPNANAGSYAPASGAIFGILNQMKEDFETNLAKAQADEVKGQEDYAGLKKTKTEELAATVQRLEDMQQEHAENKKAKYDAKEDLVLTRDQRTADVEFLRNLKTTCGDLDHQWELRSKARSDEITAVAETIAIVTDDDARDLMSKTVTLIQASETTAMGERAMRNRLVAVLRRASQQPEFDDLEAAWRDRHGPDSPRSMLNMLAVSAQLDAFTKVKEAMDQMVAELKDQQKEEVKLKQFCTTEFNKNEKETYVKTEEKEDLEELIATLTAKMETLTKEIEEATKQIADTEIEIKKASESREEENAAFQTTVAEQRATQAILKKALARLEKFYKKKALLLQRAEQTPPGGGFKPMKKSSGASPVIGMLEQIIEESIATEKDAVAGEQSAQKDYETLVKDSNDLIKELKDAITEKTKSKAEADLECEQAKVDLEAANGELEALSSYKADLHEQCDFVVKNFDLRQKARLQEIEAIGEAKAILSGSKFLQQ